MAFRVIGDVLKLDSWHIMTKGILLECSTFHAVYVLYLLCIIPVFQVILHKQLCEMHVNVSLLPESSSSFNDLRNTELFTSTEYRPFADFEFLHYFLKGIIVILIFLSLLDVASLLHPEALLPLREKETVYPSACH